MEAKYLRAQWRRAVQLGWVSDVLKLREDGGADPALILAIGSRETNLDPKYLTVPGDQGNGFGLTQADKRSFPEFVDSGKWKIAAECFAFTDSLLDRTFARFGKLSAAEGITLTVKKRDGTAIPYKSKRFDNNADLERVVIAAYNCGDWAYYHYCVGNDIDRGTTAGPSGKPDYSADVLERKAYFERALEEYEAATDSDPLAESAEIIPIAQAIDTAPNDPPPSTKPDPAQESGWRLAHHIDLGKVKSQADTAGQLLDTVAKRSDQIKSFRLFLGMKVLGVFTGLAGFWESNRAYVWAGLGIVVFFAFLYFARQLVLGIIRERQ